MAKWGQSIGDPPHFFVQLLNSSEIFIFQIQYSQTADYLVNAYINWKLDQPKNKESCTQYNQVLSFVVTSKQDTFN